jgi:hypothetical protein
LSLLFWSDFWGVITFDKLEASGLMDTTKISARSRVSIFGEMDYQLF